MTGGWLRLSRQAWKAKALVVGSLAFAWIAIQVARGRDGWAWLIAAGVVIAAMWLIGWSLRCRVCGERVFLSMIFDRDGRNGGSLNLFGLRRCPMCGDPGDGANPERWTLRKL